MWWFYPRNKYNYLLIWLQEILLKLLMVVLYALCILTEEYKLDKNWPCAVGTLNIVQKFVNETSLKVHNSWFDIKSLSLVSIPYKYKFLLLVWVAESVKQNKTHWPTLSKQNQRHQHQHNIQQHFLMKLPAHRLSRRGRGEHER